MCAQAPKLLGLGFLPTTHLHGLHQSLSVPLVRLHFLIPNHVELLEFEHVCLLNSEPLGNLARPHGLLPTVLLVELELLQPILGDLGLDILALALAVFAVLLEDLRGGGGLQGGERRRW